MKRTKKIIGISVLTLIVALGIVVIANYQKLTILSGYSAKNMASSVFIAQRTPAFTDANDNNFAPVNLAEDTVDMEAQSASASVYGLNKRTAVYRDGLGAVLITDDFDVNAPYLKPNRNKKRVGMPYPYGYLPPKDSVFTEVNYERLSQAIDSAFFNNEIQKSRAVLVIYKDHLIAEKYAEGYDQNSIFLGWSMTKSVLATVFGILQYQGKLDINQKAPIEAWQNDNRREITINDLLHMNSGLAWEEDYGGISDVTKMLFQAKDVTQIQAEKEAETPPNQQWNYSSGTTNLLSGILRQQFDTHQAYLDFPYQALIDRIGMHTYLMEADMSGNYIGSSYSWGTARDWAKFGLLYLHNGNWNGDQLFDEKWVAYVSTPAPNAGGQYGGHFWLNQGPNNYMPRVPKDALMANGYQGQRVTVIPSKDLVIVRFGLAEWPDFDFNKFLGSVCDAIP